MSDKDDDDESDKYLEARDRRYSCLMITEIARACIWYLRVTFQQ